MSKLKMLFLALFLAPALFAADEEATEQQRAQQTAPEASRGEEQQRAPRRAGVMLINASSLLGGGGMDPLMSMLLGGGRGFDLRTMIQLAALQAAFEEAQQPRLPATVEEAAQNCGKENCKLCPIKAEVFAEFQAEEAARVGTEQEEAAENEVTAPCGHESCTARLKEEPRVKRFLLEVEKRYNERFPEEQEETETDADADMAGVAEEA